VLEPLKQWICDGCGEIIRSEREGWLEFLRDRSPKPGAILTHGFRIVHHNSFAPRRPAGLPADVPTPLEARCAAYQDRIGVQDMHLRAYLGITGLADLLVRLDWGSFVDPDGEHSSEAPTREMVEIIRRLHVPYYEEARLHLAQAAEDGELDEPSNPFYVNNPDVLARIARHYSTRGAPR
jgi:hypothetical protein